MTADRDATDGGGHRREDEGEGEIVGPDDRGEGVVRHARNLLEASDHARLSAGTHRVPDTRVPGDVLAFPTGRDHSGGTAPELHRYSSRGTGAIMARGRGWPSVCLQ